MKRLKTRMSCWQSYDSNRKNVHNRISKRIDKASVQIFREIGINVMGESCTGVFRSTRANKRFSSVRFGSLTRFSRPFNRFQPPLSTSGELTGLFPLFTCSLPSNYLAIREGWQWVRFNVICIIGFIGELPSTFITS